jgi:hypothetical protein
MATLPNGAGGYQVGDGNLSEVEIYDQGTPSAYAAAGTLIVSDITAGILTYSGATGNLQLPLVSDLEAVVSVSKSNYAFTLSVIATGAGTPSLTTNTGWTIVGAAAVTNGTSGRFAVRKTAPGAWTLYRLS